MATVFGLGSILIGMIGAAIRASFFPQMMIAFPQVAEAQLEALLAVFRSSDWHRPGSQGPTRNTYSKLEINNRTQAVDMTRVFGILPAI